MSLWRSIATGIPGTTREEGENKMIKDTFVEDKIRELDNLLFICTEMHYKDERTAKEQRNYDFIHSIIKNARRDIEEHPQPAVQGSSLNHLLNLVRERISYYEFNGSLSRSAPSEAQSPQRDERKERI